MFFFIVLAPGTTHPLPWLSRIFLMLFDFAKPLTDAGLQESRSYPCVRADGVRHLRHIRSSRLTDGRHCVDTGDPLGEERIRGLRMTAQLYRNNNNNNNKLGIYIAPHQRSCSWCFTLNLHKQDFLQIKLEVNTSNNKMQLRNTMNMCAKFGCGPTVVSKKKWGGGGYRQTEIQTDRQRDAAALYSRRLR